MLYVGFCRMCGTGALGLRTCGGCAGVVVVCDECDVAWIDEDLSDPPATTGSETLPCPHCEASLYDPPSHWTTGDEVQQSDWLTHALDHNRLTLEVGQAFLPEANDPDEDLDRKDS